MSIEEEAVLANLVDDVVVVFVMINFDDWDHFRSQKNRERFLYLRRRLLLLVPNNAKMIFNRKIWRKKEANNGIGRGGGFESRWVCPKIALQSLLVDKTRERERCFKILKKNCKQDERDKQRHRERERRTFIIDVSTNWISSKERRSGEDGGKGGGILDAGSELGWRNQEEEDQRCLCLQLTDEKFWSKKSLFALN